MDRDLPTGIRRLKTSFQAYLEHAGKFYSQTFPLTTPLLTMKDWRERKRASLKYGTPIEPARTFAEDAADYLKLCPAITSYAVKKYHIDQWSLAFGTRDRKKLTAADIRLQLETWRKTGRFDGKALTVASLNRRRTDLMAMFTALDGRSHPNIVKDVPAYRELWRHQIRAQPMPVILRAKRQTRRGSKTWARLSLFTWSGWPNAIVKALRPIDIDWRGGRVKLPPRHKGQGMPAAWVKVLPETMKALKRFDHAKAYGSFSNSSIHTSWVLACETAEVPTMRVYDIRHSFATWVAPRIKDDRALKELLRTNSIERYTQAAALSRLEQAIVLLEQSSGRLNRSDRHAKVSSRRAVSHAVRQKFA